MKDVNEIYLSIVDEVVAEIDKDKPETREELSERIEEIKEEYIDDLESAFSEIEYDYADNNDLYDEDEED